MLTAAAGSAICLSTDMKSPFNNQSDYEYAMDQVSGAAGDVLCGKIRQSTAYLSPKLTIKATAQRKQDKRAKQITMLVTIGAPNFVERRFIRVCQKKGQSLPLGQRHFKLWPKKK